MKKIALMSIAALAMTFAACGNKSENKAEANTETPEKEAPSYITYTNDNYGYSVEVPGDMSKRETMTEENGTIFSYDGEEGVTFNRIDITGSKNFFDEEYTPEKVKSDFEYYTENKEVVNAEYGDDYLTYTVVGDDLTQIDWVSYKDSRSVMITVCYDKEHEKQLGSEVAKRVFNSIKFF